MKSRWIAALTYVLAGMLALAQARPARAAQPQTCETVRMAGPGWTDIDATNAVAGVILKALGYRQNVSNLSVPITYQGLKKGQIDVFLGNWMPAQGPLVKPFADEHAIDVLHANLSGAKFTLAVPDYVADAGVRTFADLAKHADQFGRRIYGIEPGAPANQNIKKMIADNAFGLGNWSIVESSETGMLTQVERAGRDRKWIVFLAWEPHLMNTKFHLRYLALGDAYFGPNYGGATVNTVTRAGFTGECANLAVREFVRCGAGLRVPYLYVSERHCWYLLVPTKIPTLSPAVTEQRWVTMGARRPPDGLERGVSCESWGRFGAWLVPPTGIEPVSSA